MRVDTVHRRMKVVIKAYDALLAYQLQLCRFQGFWDHKATEILEAERNETIETLKLEDPSRKGEVSP